MPYTNIGQLIEPYLRPLGKQTIEQIPGIQAHQLAKERLGGQKQVWAEQIAESKANREIQRQAQAKQLELMGLAQSSPEAFKNMVPPGTDPETLLKGIFGGAMGKMQPQYPAKEPPAWKEIETRDAQGNLVKQFIDVSKQAPGQQYQIPTQKVKIGNKTFDVPIEAATALEAYRMKEIADDDKWKRERDEKRRKDEIKYLEDRMEDAKAIGPAAQEMYTIYTKKLSDLIGQSTAGVARDPEVDKARSMIMEAVQDIKMYEKASQDQEDKGAPLAPTSMPQMPPRQFMMPPAKKDKEITPSQQINQLKLAAWNKYSANSESLTIQEKQLLGLQKDYIERASQMVAGDMQKAFLPIDQKVDEVLRIAEIMRAASETKPKSGEINLPSTIKTTSQAIEYLMSEKKMTKEKAIEWLRSQQ